MTPDTNRAARIEEIVAAHLREMLAGRGVAEDALIAEHDDLLPEIELELHKVRLFGAACDWMDQRATPNTADTSSLFDAHDSSLPRSARRSLRASCARPRKRYRNRRQSPTSPLHRVHRRRVRRHRPRLRRTSIASTACTRAACARAPATEHNGVGRSA